MTAPFDTHTSLLRFQAALLLVFRWIEIGKLGRVKQFLDLRLSEKVLLANDFDNPLAARIGLLRELGRLVVAK